MEYFTLLILVSGFISGGFCAKCMTPEDARYITPSQPVPDLWRNRGWHTGDFFPAPEPDTGGFSRRTSLFLTTQDAGALVWWLKGKDSNFYTILTKDQSHILCTLIGAGLQVGWQAVSTEAKRSGYCHWDVTANPHDPSLFQIRNAELRNPRADIGAVFLNRTGLYFDYAASAKNDPANRVAETLTWWKWRHSTDDQANMSTLPNECELGESGLPLFMEETEITGRSLGRRRRARYRFGSADKFARCGDRWYLYRKKCYRIYTAPGLNHYRTSRVCNILGGRVVLPESAAENNFVSALVRKKANGTEYWLGAVASTGGSPPRRNDFKSPGSRPLGYSRWKKRMRTLSNQRCVLFSNGRWNVASCNITTGRVLCERHARVRELPGHATCGKIQERSVDAAMADAAGHKGNRIVGGYDALNTQFPWQAAIRFKKGIKVSGVTGKVYHNCGGALIDKCWVLSAAHCFYDRDEKIYEVRLGDFKKNSRDGTEQEFDIQTLIIHEEYQDIPSHRRDISLIKLKRNTLGQCATFNTFVQPVCLPTPDFFIADEGERCQVSGWGVTDPEEGQISAANTLQWVTIPTLRNSICASRYNKLRTYFLEDVMFCAGYKEGGKDSCSGDSGGPFVCRGRDGRYSVAGIVSFGIGCARKVYPGVYTRVRHFIPWITEKIWGYGGGSVIPRPVGK